MTAQELKNSILMQAVQGKLVPQDPNDEPASVLLAKIRAEKEQMMKEGKIKKEPISEIYVDPSDNQHYEKVGKTVKCIEDEIPFQIPKGWEWCRLVHTMSVYGGKRVPAGKKLVTENTGHKYIRVTDMKNETILTNDIHYINNEIYDQIKRYTISCKDLYITVAGTIGKVGSVPVEFNGANLTENADKLITYDLENDYLKIMMNSTVVQTQITDATTKVGQPKLAIIRIQNLLIPIPPLKEQKRIANRVAELKLYVEKYQHLCEKINLINGSIKEKLKKSILQYAIEGKLVKQNPNDEPASELIKRIRLEKEKLIKSGKLKKDKNESFIYRGSDNSYYEKFQNGKEVCIDDEIPFEIPQSWEWIRFGNLVNFQLGKTPEREKVKYWQNGKYKWVSISDMVSNGYVLDTKEYVSEDAKIEKFSKLSPAGTLIMSFKLTVGKISILGCDAFHNEAIISIFPLKDSGTTTRDYLFKVLPHIVKYGDEKKSIKGVTLNSKSIAKLMIPLPPIAEQQRIVSAIKECFNLLK